MKIKKALINLLCASLVLGNITPALAAVSDSESNTYQNEVNETKETEVLYTRSASYFVTIPKRITLGSDKASQYSVKVEGDIPSDKEVYVSPIDSIDGGEFDFYMHDQNTNNPKADVIATVTQSKFFWNFQDTADGYTERNNQVEAAGLTAGTWKGTFDFEINMHQIAHTHSYTETISKEPTCTETGEKTYSCSCGDSYVEVIPVTEHNYVDNICTVCGKEMDPYEIAPVNALDNWDYTLDDERNIVTLNFYIGDEADVVVYEKYSIGTETYKTRLASNVDGATKETPYMFNAYTSYGHTSPSVNCQNINSIAFSKKINTSNVTNMSYMFYNCESLKNLDITCFDTSNVTDMNSMFRNCGELTSLDVSRFNTGKVTNMNSMFSGCQYLRIIDVSKFNTDEVTDMRGIFQNCQYVRNLDISRWNTGNVTDMRDMFSNCLVLESLDLSSFDTTNVKSMGSMFANCRKITELDLSSFDTSNVTYMMNMFFRCESLENVNLTSFDTSNVNNMRAMFSNSSSLMSLDLTNFDTKKVEDMSEMFCNCASLSEIRVMDNKWDTTLADAYHDFGYGMFDTFCGCGTDQVTYVE